MLDLDNSGELEPHEVLEFEVKTMGKPADQQAKDDFRKTVDDMFGKIKAAIT